MNKTVYLLLGYPQEAKKRWGYRILLLLGVFTTREQAQDAERNISSEQYARTIVEVVTDQLLLGGEEDVFPVDDAVIVNSPEVYYLLANQLERGADEIIALQEQIDDLTNRVQELEWDVEQKEKQIDELIEENKGLEREIEGLRYELELLQDKLDELER